MVQLDKPQMTIWRMRIAFWITNATYIHTRALPRQQWLCERASLGYTYIASLVMVGVFQISSVI